VRLAAGASDRLRLEREHAEVVRQPPAGRDRVETRRQLRILRGDAGTAHLDFQDPTRSTARITIQVASVLTNQKQRDEHLRTGDFFDAPTYPEITFTSTKAEVVGDDTYRLTGDLTIKDVTKPVSIDFEFTGAAKDPYGNIRVGFDGSTTVKRSDWGISWNAALETGGVMVSDKITLEFDISAIKNA
jgi:polyisoprenoid-binding protein YceI